MRDPYDATAFDGYQIEAAPDAASITMTCVLCPDAGVWDYDPSPSNALEVVQTMRTHNLNCPARRPKPHPPKEH